MAPAGRAVTISVGHVLCRHRSNCLDSCSSAVGHPARASGARSRRRVHSVASESLGSHRSPALTHSGSGPVVYTQRARAIPAFDHDGSCSFNETITSTSPHVGQCRVAGQWSLIPVALVRGCHRSMGKRSIFSSARRDDHPSARDAAASKDCFDSALACAARRRSISACGLRQLRSRTPGLMSAQSNSLISVAPRSGKRPPPGEDTADAGRGTEERLLLGGNGWRSCSIDVPSPPCGGMDGKGTEGRRLRGGHSSARFGSVADPGRGTLRTQFWLSP